MILRYALKSTRATVQLALTLVVGLITVFLVFKTVNLWRFESNLRDGILAYASGEDAMTPLRDAATLRPDEPLPYLYQGQFYLERGMRARDEANATKKDKSADYAAAKSHFENARKCFDLAQEARKAKAGEQAVSDTALVGAACALLGLAECSTSEEKPALLDEASKDLEQAAQDNAEVVIARAQLALVKGDQAAAQKAVDDAASKLGGAGRAAVGSFYWARTLLGVLGRKASAVDDARRTLLFSCTNETARALSLAIRIACADSSAAPSDAAQLEERCKAMSKILDAAPRVGKGRSQGLDHPAEAAAWNAIAEGHVKALDFEAARMAFVRAKNLDSDASYRVNEAAVSIIRAGYRPEDSRESPHDWKRNRMSEGARALAESFRNLPNDRPVDNPKACDALMIAAGIWHALGAEDQAKATVTLAHEKYALDEKEYDRTYGALEDWTTALKLAVPLYKKAIELNHKDAAKMQARIAAFEREGKK